MGASLEALVRNFNIIGVARLVSDGVGLEELEKVMDKLGVPIVSESKRETLLRSLEEWRRMELSREHLGNNRPKPVSEMVTERKRLVGVRE